MHKPIIKSDCKEIKLITYIWREFKLDFMKKVLLTVGCFISYSLMAQWNGNNTLNNAVCNFSVTTTKTNSVSCSDGNGGAFVAWIDNRDIATGGDVYIQRINSNGSLVFASNGLVVCNAVGSQSNISMVPDGSGGVFIAWQDPRSNPSPANLTYVQRVSSTGSMLWAANGVTAMQNISASQTVPIAVVTSLGDFFVVTRDTRTTATTGTDVYVQKLNATTGAPILASDLAIVTATGSQTGVQVATDTSGNFVIVWSDPRTPGSTSNSQIYAQKVNANGTVAWAIDGVVVCSNQSNNRLDPAIAFASSLNDYVISWTDLRAGNTDANIYAQRISGATGAGVWATNGVVVCAATASQSASQIKITSDNAPIITWIDPRTSATTNNDIYIQKLNLATGAAFSAGWVTDGVVVCNVATSQALSNNAILPNNVGGAYIVWSDARTGGTSTPNDIYSLSLNGDASITTGWVANGNFVCNATGTQTTANIVPSTTNRFIVSWQDGRNGIASGEIYASRVETNGVLPLQLGQLFAKRDKENIILNWETVNEHNNSHFEVEKLNTNNSFVSLGNVPAKNTATNAYSFTNTKAGKGVNLFRLKMVDAAGKFSYSNTVRVDIDGLMNNSLSIYPNPVKSMVQFTFNANEKELVTLNIISAQGKILKTQLQQMIQGYNTVSINIADLTAGNYVLQVVDSKHKRLATQSFVK